MFVEKIYRIIK